MHRGLLQSWFCLYDGCHATPMDLHMKNYGGLDLEPKERKNYRKICYFLGIMINEKGQRFLDEGKIRSELIISELFHL